MTTLPRIDAATTFMDSSAPSTESPLEIGRYLQVVYPELRRIAHSLMRSERPGHTLIPTALLHEAVIRLLGISDLQIIDSRHFFLLAVIQMRRVLASYARRKLALKRSAAARAIVQDDELQELNVDIDQIVIVDQMMERLATIDDRACQVVGLRFFAGFTGPEIAAILQLSETTVERDWQFAKLWLCGEYQRDRAHDR